MNIVIIADDKKVIVDGKSFDIPDMDFSGFHAIEVNGNQIEVQYKDGKRNEKHTDMSRVKPFLDAWQVKRDEEIAEYNRIVAEREAYLASWDYIRDERDKLLAATDWTQVGDSPLKDSKEMTQYRQKLRDITKDFKTPADVVFPTKP